MALPPRSRPQLGRGLSHATLLALTLQAGCGDTIYNIVGPADGDPGADSGGVDAGGSAAEVNDGGEGPHAGNLLDAGGIDAGDSIDAGAPIDAGTSDAGDTIDASDGGDAIDGAAADAGAVDAGDAGPDAAEAEADAGPTGSDEGYCKAGLYVGSLEGTWRPGAFDLGGGLTLINVRVEARETDLTPGLWFTLEAGASAVPGSRAAHGCVVGTATAVGGIDSHPWLAKLTGSVDCATGEFTGTLDGRYALFDTGELSTWYFDGPITGDVHASGDSVAGLWDMREKQTNPNEDPGAGGEGSWEASWESVQTPDSLRDCEALAEPGDGDAGAEDGGVGDAGVAPSGA